MLDNDIVKTVKIINDAQKNGILLFLDNDIVKYTFVKGASIDQRHIEEIKKFKAQIKIVLRNKYVLNQNNAIPVGPRPQKIPLSFSQERLWFINALGGSLQYHIPFVLRLKGELDSGMLQKALMTIVNRHEALRMVIAEEDGQPYQHILDENGWRLGNADNFVYTTELSMATKIEELTQAPFNLSTDYLLRADLIKTSPNEHVLVGTMHHIVSDGWSLPILVSELTELYNAFSAGRPYQLPDLPVQYADYAIWQREYLSGDVLQNKLAYWQQQLSAAPVMQLPTDHPRSPVRSTRGSSETFLLDSDLAGRLETLSLENGATLYMTLLSTFKILLSKYTGQDDICVGSPIAGRPAKEIQGLIGFFINTLVIRSQVSPDMTFRDLLLQVKNTTLNAYAHEEVPFEKVVEAIVIERDLSRNPLFDVMFALQNNTQPDSWKEALPGLSLSVVEKQDHTTKFDLSVTLQQQAGGITGLVTYNSDLYDPATIRRMIAHYQRLLEAVASDQDQLIGQLPMITEAERQQLLFGFNDTHTDYPRNKTIVDLFYEQAAKTPGNIALVFEDQQLTYQQLDERSNQLARYLQQQGVREESLVVICMERSLEMIIGILGILKAGGAYVPIDPDYPEERIAYILEDTAAPIALTGGNVRLPVAGDLTVINIDNSLINIQHTARLNSQLQPGHLAYVIYTSGSTGQPKGVMIQHAGLGLLFGHINNRFSNTPSAVAMAFTASYTFDISVFQLFTPLLSGGRSILVNKQTLGDIAQLTAILQQASMIDTVPAVYSLLVDHIVKNNLSASFNHIQKVFIGGDVIPDQLLAALPAAFPAADIIALYGPTETTMFRTNLYYHSGTLLPGSKGAIIGRPISNTQVYILGPRRDLLPIGVTGEICIGGAGLARGYLNRPDLTAEKFIPDPFSTDEDACLYRTGDLGRWLPDGNIEFLGRLDDQVKVRGYRIEPGEIESALVQTGLVQQAVVLAKEDQQGNKRLIAYIVPTAGYTQESTLTHLRAKLPEYMVPGLLAELDALPLTPNGKTDRRALLQMDLSAQQEYEAPEDTLEIQLAAIWSDLLGAKHIGRHNNFFQLGGHSLMAMRLVAAIRNELGTEVGIAAIFNHPTIAALGAYIASATDATPALPVITTDARPQKIPLSFSQERLWFIDAMGGSLPYHLPFVFRLGGELDRPMLQKALMTIVNRHEVLRTVIAAEDGQPYQHILDKDGWQLGDADNFVHTTELALAAKIQELIQTPFNLSTDHLLRADLIKTGPTEHVLVGTMHHIVSDGWSLPILVSELKELYNAFAAGRTYQLPELPVQYADYAIWQRAYLSGDVLQNKLAYWQQQLSDAPVLQLPTDYPRGRVRSNQGASEFFLLDRDIADRLETLSLESGATLFMTLLTTFNILLSKYSGQDDICIGTPVAGRPIKEIEGLIGFFINTLVVRSKVSPDMSFRDLLLQVKKTTLDAYSHQDVPFEKIVETVVTERDMSRNPLFDVMFILQNNIRPDSLEEALSGLSLSSEENQDHTAKFDLSVTLQQQAGGVTGLVTYNSDLYDPATIRRMIVHYQRLLEAVTIDQEQPIGQLPMITEAERKQLLSGFNDTYTDYPLNKTIVDLFYEQATKTPDSLAVVFKDERLTYRQLDERSNQLARYLQQHGVCEDSLVIICMNRSLEMIIAILGTLKAGGAYVPVDPDYPQQRIDYMLEDTAAPIALTAGSIKLSETDDLKVIHLQTDSALIDIQPTERINTQLRSDHLAYIIYTSGSTGQPKGVMIEHSSLVNYVLWFNTKHSIDKEDSTLLLSQITFDGVLTSLFGSLLSGATLHVIDQSLLHSSIGFASYIAENKISFLKITPSLLNLLISEDRSFEVFINAQTLRWIFIGGEQIDIDAVIKIKRTNPSVNIINHYGPTETTIGVTTKEIKKITIPIPIGRPISNTQVFILDPNRDPVPLGVIGEICIGGAGLARGYLNRPDLTAEKFIRHPFSTNEDARIYRTGDLGRWLPDGNVEFLGRRDHQVKIRGYRIELGEIETVLAQNGLVQQAVVLAKEDPQGNKRLVAYVVPADGYTQESALTHLRAKLPEYMVPGLLIELDALPITSNGKTDRKALLQMDLSAAIQLEYEAPESALEMQLAATWSNLLTLQRIGRHDNFFQLGGHSLLAMRLIAAIRTELGTEVNIRTIFEHPTVALLATIITSATDATPALPVIIARPRPGKIPLTFSQERLWFIDALEGTLPYYLPFVLRLGGELDRSMLQKALMTIINRHEVLRTVIGVEEGQPYQRILDENGWQLGNAGNFVYTTELAFAVKIDELMQLPFNLATDHLLRADLIKTGPDEHVLVGTLHHIASDGWSIPILVSELKELYSSFVAGRPYRLPELPVQYADYAIWQREYLSGEVLQNKLAYWQQQLADASVLQLPTDHPRSPVRSTNGASERVKLDGDLTGQLGKLSQENGATLYMTLLSAFNILLYKYSGQNDFCIGTPIAGRQQQEVEGLIGFFINTLVIRSQVSPDMSFRELLLQVKKTTLDAYAHQDVPFEKIVDALVIDRDLSRHPLFDVTFALHNQTQLDTWEDTLSGLSLSPEGYTNNTAQFDLSFALQQYEGGITGLVTYNSDLYDPATIQRMISHYKRLLQSVTADQDKPVGTLEMITEAERQQILYGFNDNFTDYPRDKTIVDLFYEQAAKTPDNIAVVFEDHELTYRQLDERSNQLARYLQQHGVRKESLVVICMERSLEMIIGILGILKAGGAYVPIDPDYPQERIAYMLEDTAALIALTGGNVRLPDTGNLTVIRLDTDKALINAQDIARINNKLKPDSLAYVIYTSGSTGWPKGVMIEHGSVISLVTGVDYVNLLKDNTLLVAGSISFDATTFEYWAMLLYGGKIVLTTQDALLSPALLKAAIRSHNVNIMFFTTSWFNQLVENDPEIFASLRTVLTGGEKYSEYHIEQILQTYPQTALIHAYGPTENTTFSLTCPITDNMIQSTIPIGRPLNNRSAYILTPSGQLSPIGACGEILLGGVGLARGYLNRSDLTAEKFIPHPFSTDEDARLYRTGDLGRWLPDGNIEFLGRLDDQVKIRGYRVEPGEIGSALVQTGLVQQAVVLVKEDPQGNKRLIGYIVPAASYTQESAFTHLRSNLPEYMIPGLLVELDALPLTSNGKTDRKALLQMDLSAAAQSEYEAPEGTLEVHLASMWSNLLGTEHIGRHDNFFQLGGHSLLAMRLVAAIRTELGTEIGIATIFNHPTIAALATFIASATDATPALPAIIAGPRPQKIPLSFSQERLWFIDALEGSVQYHIPFVLRLEGEPDGQVLQMALRTIVNRHEVLRTVIVAEDGQPYQHILDKDGWQLGNADDFVYTTELLLASKIEELIQTPFNLATDYLLRADLIKTGPAEHVLIGTLHHIVSDGWSLPVLVSELTELYNAFVAGRPYQLPDLPVQYADYAIWQREYLSGEVLQNKLAYWQQQLADAPVLQLPTDHPRGRVRSNKGASEAFLLDSDLTGQLNKLSFDNGATLFMTLLSTFNILLCKYSGQNDICIGTPIAGRPIKEIEGLIGFFINTLVVRSQVSPNMSFRELLLQVKKATLDAYAHQDAPFEKIVEMVVTERDMSRNPLFDVRFTLHNTPETGKLDLGSTIGLIAEYYDQGHTQTDIGLDISSSNDGLTGSITYNSDLYEPATIRRMINHFQQLLKAVAVDQDQTIGTLNMITEAERQELLFSFNDTLADYPRDKTVVELFYEQAAKTPDNIALVFEEHKLTYRQLDERSNQLAHLLRSRGVREESLVVICMERSVEMIIAILGILKAGGAYVPIDPGYPEERIAYILEDTAAQIALTAGNVQLPTAGDLTVIDVCNSLIDAQDSTTVTTRLRPDHLAYVIYTSGSTGWPKGVMIEHASLVNYIYSSRSSYLNENPGGAGSFVHLSYSFDASITSLFLPLIAGKSIIVTSKDLLTMFEEDDNLQKYAPYDFIKLTPSHLEFIEHSENLSQRIIVGGEALRVDHFRHLANKNITIINEYGPTESTVGCTIYSVDHSNGISQDTVSIGRPIANTQIYILDDSQKLVPIGVTGEICIGGAGLARGYLNRSDLTAEKFIPHPFSTDEDARIYRTGDLGRWLPDGNIEFLGRLDDQVKIRGYRIEPGEIESALVQTGLVQQAVVLAKEDQRLIAYVVPAAGYTQESTLTHLRSKLPEYMLPGLLVELETLPLTSNGKIDRKALLQIDPSAVSQSEYEAPANLLETQLASMWSNLLGTERIGRHDNFFQLGGHSLLAMRLVAATRKELGTELSIATIFDHPTIAALSSFIASTTDATPALPAIIPGERPQKIPLSFSQERLWFIDALEGSLQYHIPFVFRLKGELDRPMLQKALMTIVNRHEVLRTIIQVEDGQAFQCILDENGWQLGNASNFVYTTELFLTAKIEELIQTPFKLSSDHLLRADLIKTGPAEHILIGTLHHIVSDGWSLPVLVSELKELYNAFVVGRPYRLPDLPVQYADYAIWQRAYLSGDVLQHKLAYWQQQLAAAPVLQLPTDHPRGAVRSTRGASEFFLINRDIADKLETLSLDNGATLFMTLLSAFNILLYKYIGQDDICIGTPIAGRPIKEIEALIGFFVNTLVIRSKVSPDMSFRDLLLQVKKTTLDAYAHQDVPFEKIVEAVTTERNMSRNPLFDVTFILQNNIQPDNLEEALSGLSLSLEEHPNNTTRFDLSVALQQYAGGITGSVTYNSDLYDPATIQRMITHYQQLLQAVATDPDQTVGTLDMITEAERHQLLFGFNDTYTDYPRNKTIVDLFYEQAAKTPDNIAVVFEDHELTYRQLDERSNQLAHLLRSHGVREESLIVICMERSLEMIIGLLGILKAGGAYVPIDPAYPQERIAYMLEDTAASIVLTAGNVQLPAAGDLTVINIGTGNALIDSQDIARINTRLRPDHLAHVIYTSGSTGRPKGVMIEHGSVVSLVTGVDYVTLHKDNTLLVTGSISFDATTLEYWAMLLNGGKLVLTSLDTLLSPASLKAAIRSHNVNIMFFTTSWFNQLVENNPEIFAGLETVLTGGEKCSEYHFEQLLQTYPQIELTNMYGPTENTTLSLTCRITDNMIQSQNQVPVGRPLNNRSAYILTPSGQLSAMGACGEILVGGAGLARGYLNRPDLTAEKFIPHPFSTDEGARLYRTGDLGRWLPDGNIEFLGRLDDQVKIRGYRIEPGEIESALMQTGLVQQAVVLVKEDPQGNKRLIGYIVPADGYTQESALTHLRAKLPEYMVPNLLAELDTLPLTPSGKIDRKALLQIDLSASTQPGYEAPASTLEAQLATIWSDLLGAEHIGRHDNFFQLGGDSIISIQVVSRLQQAGHHVRPRDIFMHQTIAALAGAIAAQQNSHISAEQELLSGESGLLPIQQWFLTHQHEHPSHFNQSVLLAIDKEIPIETLQLAVQLLTERHDALRFTYEQQADGWIQRYSPGPVLPLIVEQLTSGTGQITDIANVHQSSLDIHKGELVRIVLIETLNYDSQNRLLIIIHHLVVDGVSWRILLKDLETITGALMKGNTPALGMKSSSFRQWYNSLAEYGKTSRLLAQRDYWKATVQKYSPLPYDLTWSGKVQLKDLGHCSSRLDQALTKALLTDVPAVYHTEINDILLVALAKTLCEWSGASGTVIGLEGHGREDIFDGIDLSHTVGWFTTIYPVWLSKAAGPGAADWIKTIKEQLRKVPDKGLGYGVLKYINKEPQLQQDASWDIVFNYFGQLDTVLQQGSSLAATGESKGQQASPQLLITEKISINSMVIGGELIMNWSYSTLHFTHKRIQQLSQAYLDNLQLLISHCAEQQKSGNVLTPSDYGLGNEISYDELDSFLQKDGNIETDTIIEL